VSIAKKFAQQILVKPHVIRHRHKAGRLRIGGLNARA
jgi:hypothetical protein